MKPILFSTPMVRALLNTKPITWPAEPIDPSKPYKWQTRRVIKTRYYSPLLTRYRCGDILWVRETFARDMNGCYIYRSDPMFNGCGKGDIPWNWKPSLFMPKEAARLFLKVKSVRIEKLHEITEEDAEAEGIDNQLWYVDSDGDEINLAPYSGKVPSPNFKTGFADLWDRINKKRGYGWSENPYVYIYEFMRLDAGKE